MFLLLIAIEAIDNFHTWYEFSPWARMESITVHFEWYGKDFDDYNREALFCWVEPQRYTRELTLK